MTDLEALKIRTRPLISAPIVSSVLFEPDMRHAGLWLRGDELWVFWTRVGDAPERILLSMIDLSRDWSEWRASDPVEVRRATEDWEGGKLPAQPSVRSAVNRPVNQLRDP